MIDDLDPVIHAPKRLAIMAILASSTTTDFSFLREHLDVSESDMSKQISALERVGYLTVTKTSRGRGGATRYRATSEGLTAYKRHLAALRAIVGASIGAESTA